MAELYKRKIRIEGKPDETKGYLITVHDAETGKWIPGIFKIGIHLSVQDDNLAEITYYEAGDGGGVMVGSDGQPIVHSAIAEKPQVHLTALERCATTIGGYECHLEVSHVAGKPHGFITIEDEARNAVQFYPDEALALLKWLQQERQNLEELAKTASAHTEEVASDG